MAKARVIDDDTADENREAEELASLNQATGGNLFSVIEELRGSAAAAGTVCLVTRVATEKKPGGYCGKIALQEFTLDTVKSRFGPGRYLVQIKGPKGFLPGGSPVEIAETPGDEDDEPRSSGGDLATYLQFVKSQEIERAARHNRLLELAIPSLGTILAAFLQRPSGTDVAGLVAALKPAPGPSLADLTTAMVNMKTLNAAAPVSDPIDQLVRVLEVAKDFGGADKSGGGNTNWLDIAKELISQAGPAVGPVLQAVMARGRPGAPPSTRPTVNIVPPPAIPSVAVNPPPAQTAEPAAPVSAGSAGEKSGENEVDMLSLMKPFIIQKLKMVSQWAAEKKDPALYAEIFLKEHVPSNVQDYLPAPKALEYLNNARWFEEVCKLQPALAPFKSWCDQFRSEIIYWVSESISPGSGDREETPADQMSHDGGYTGFDS
jgi:hypothetical protein